jgi:hypothetical protein
MEPVVRAQLDAVCFERVWVAGGALSREQALSFAVAATRGE